MYLFLVQKNYNLLNYSPVLRVTRTKHDIYNAVEIIKNLGGRIYQLDLNAFAKISKLDNAAKLKFLTQK